MSQTISDPGELEHRALQDFRSGRFAAAIEGFRAARDLYRQAGDGLRAAQAANNLSVALLQAGQGQAALQAVEDTPGIFAQARDQARLAEATGNLAAAFEAVGKLDQAEDRYREAADMFLQLRMPEAEAHTRRALSAMLLRRGRPTEATAAMERALEVDPRAGLRGRWLRKILHALSRGTGR